MLRYASRHQRSTYHRTIGLLTALGLLVPLLLAGSVPAAAAAQNTLTNDQNLVIMGYWARWGSDPAPLQSLQNSKGILTVLSPYWYTLTSSGTLSSRENDHQQVLKLASKQGDQVLAMVNNGQGTAMFTDPTVRARSVEAIVQMVKANHYAGVNIDFEGLSPSLRGDLTAFMQALYTAMHTQGLLVTQALPPKWSSDNSVNQPASAFDYSALAKVNDYVVLMTYDHHGTWSGPGPVAGIDWVRQVVQFTLTRVPAQKVILGVAGYGYDWGPASTRTVNASSAAGLATLHQVTPQWDSSSQEAHFTYQGADGTHEVWYENSNSIKAKLHLAEQKHLAGLALWSLGEEEPSLWPILAGAGTTASLGPSDLPFPDLAGSWAAAAVEELVQQGIVSGYPNGTFRPQRPVTRAEFVKLLLAGLGIKPEPGPSMFSDVDGKSALGQYVNAAARAGLVAGGPGDQFRPQAPVTRAEMAAMLVRALLQERVSTANLASQPPVFTDATSNWAYSSIELAAGWGLVGGFPDESFKPHQNLTRAQAAAVIQRLLRVTS